MCRRRGSARLEDTGNGPVVPHRRLGDGMTPKFSILISNYNYGAYVGAAIESALGQTWSQVEVIVVDDGSTDDSRDVIARYPAVKAIHQENQGQCVAIRRALEAATGDLVITLDSDDELVPQTCERVAALWRDGIVALQYRLETFGITDLAGETLPRYAFIEGDVSRYFLETGSMVYPPASGNAFDRAFALRVFEVSQGMIEASHDIWLCLSAALLGKVDSTDEILGRYRIHANNLSQPGRTRKMSNILRDTWYAYNAQQSAFEVARSYGMTVEKPSHLIGAYYLNWHFLLRGASTKWVVPEAPTLPGLVTGLRNFGHLNAIGPLRRYANMVALVVIALSPRALRRIIAERWYGYVNDVGF